MDNCYIESGSIIAAGAVLLEGSKVGKCKTWAGVPAKKVKDISPELFEDEVMRKANHYVKYSA